MSRYFCCNLLTIDTDPSSANRISCIFRFIARPPTFIQISECRARYWYSKFVRPSVLTYCVSQKNPPRGPDIFSFFHKRWRICNRFFTHLLNVPIFARLQIFIQLSQILTKLCHIKRDYPVFLTHTVHKYTKVFLEVISMYVVK